MHPKTLHYVHLHEMFENSEEEEDFRSLIDSEFTYGDCSYSLVHQDNLRHLIRDLRSSSPDYRELLDNVLDALPEGNVYIAL